MKIILAFVALLAAAQAAPGNLVNPIGLRETAHLAEPIDINSSQRLRTPSGRIVGGILATPGLLPYQAQLEIDSWGFCGGSLISSQWVLTASHCVSNTSQVEVTLGSTKLSASEEGRVVVQSSRVIPHPQWDIALIELAEEVTFSSTVQPVKLANNHSIDYAGNTARVSGFGQTSDTSDVSDVLYYVDVLVISNEQCIWNIGEERMCTQEPDPNVIGNACYGDSGGPVVDLASGRQIGVTAFGAVSCENGAPEGQTRVSYFIDWIESNTGLSL